MWHNVRSQNNQVYLVQMQDLSLHRIQGTKNNWNTAWTRQEGLSTIKQMEILEQAENEDMVHGSFDYIKNWNQPVSFVNVPARIIQRYTENINSAINYVLGTLQKL